MDVQGLVSRLPDIHQAGQKLITAFEENTSSYRLAMADIRDILTQVTGKDKTDGILSVAGWTEVTLDEKYDHWEFGPY